MDHDGVIDTSSTSQVQATANEEQVMYEETMIDASDAFEFAPGKNS